MPQRLTFTRGVRDGLPIGLGYLSVSIALGIMAAGKGMPLWGAALFAGISMTGTGDLVGINLLAIGGGLIEMICAIAVINARYMLMSLSLTQKLPEDMPMWKRLLIAFGNTDEVFAVASTQVRPLNFSYMMGLILLPVVGWTGGTIIGEAAGNLFTGTLIAAMNIAIYAMYIAIIIPAARKSLSVLLVVLTAAGLSCLLTYLPEKPIGDGWIIIIAGVTASALGALLFPRKEDA
jgi:predicted branched-subunit amino acid permease